jgi:hypothetical protein
MLQTGTDGAAEDLFAYTAAIRGDTVVVGAPRDDTPAGSWAGSAYAGTLSGSTWTLDATLTHPEPEAIDNFGRSVDLDAGTLVVGTPRDKVAGAADAGSAEVFVQSGPNWTLEATLTHPEPAETDVFGRWAAISGDTVIVGAPRDDIPGGVDAGSAEVFTRSGTTWSLEAVLTAPSPRAGGFFGKAVEIDGDTIVVGEPAFRHPETSKKIGAAHVFVRSGTTWTWQATLFHPSPNGGDNFGRWVSVDGNTAVVSAPADRTAAGPNAGSVHVFVRSGTSWIRQALLRPPNQQAGDSFGHRQTLVGNTVLAGSRKGDTVAGSSAGTAHVFVRSGTTWTHQATLTSPTPAATDQFGRAVALNEDATMAVVGEPYDDAAGRDAGAAHVFALVGGTWEFQATIINPNTTPP